MTTETNGAGAELPGKAELFELIVDSATDFAIFTIDAEGTATTWNSGAQRLFGFDDDEMLGASSDAIFTPEDRRTGAPEQERIQARTEGRAIDERWHMRKDGSRFWASGQLMPLRGGGERFVKITCDRTEQHEAELQVRENEERFRLLATSIPELVFRTRPDGDRTWGSPQWIEFTGLSLERSLGQGWMDAIHPEDREATRSAWSGALEQGEYHVEHRIRRQEDGEYRWHQTRARPIDPDRPIGADWVGTMSDIHELRGFQGRQAVLVAELQHRTRNLLAIVQSIASTTIRSSRSLGEFQSEYESRLRALSRVQSLLAQADQSDIDLATLVQLELVAHGDAGLATGKIVVSGPPVTLPPSSAQALGLALHELATNAVKYGALKHPEGRLQVRWRVHEEGMEPVVELEWRESGVPIPAGRPARRGYGLELIEQALPYQLEAETRLEFGPDGVRCVISAPAPTSPSAKRGDGRG